MTLRALAIIVVLGASLGSRAADGPAPAEWPTIDKLVEVDLLSLDKLKKQIVIDMETGAGSDHCPKNPWTGRATYVYPDGEEIVYFGTGIYCAPVGYGRVQYADGRVYVGQVNSFLASASATLTQDQFRPAVRHGNGKLERKGAAPLIGRFDRGAHAADSSKDAGFLKAFDAAETSLPDRYAPLMTSAVAKFIALPASSTPARSGADAFVNASAYAADDSIAAAGAAVVAASAAKAAVTAPAAAASDAFIQPAGPAKSTASVASDAFIQPPAVHSGGGLALGAGAVAVTTVAAGGQGGGMVALPAPLPSDFDDMSGMMGFAMPNEAAVAGAKQLDKEYQLKTRGNNVFYGMACPKAGFLGLKPWRARVVYTETFSGRIVYDGVGFGCGPLGPGRIEFEDGSVYEGVVSTFTNSRANPVGNFEPAVPTGAGRFTFADGTVVEGNWLRGELNGGPMTVTKPGGQPQAFVSGTLAALRAGALNSAPAASVASVPAATGKSMGGIVAPSMPGTPAMQGVAAAAAAGMVAGSSPSGALMPFTPAGSAGLPFTPAGAGAVAATEVGPGKAGPQPMLGNTGTYLCPYTEDGVVAQWVDKAIKARMGGAIGGMVGAEAGKELFKNIPMFGSMFGKAVGDKIGRETAIKMAGGWEFIRANSDQSFDNVSDYVTWMRMNYKGSEHYNDVVAAIKELYPELKTMQF